MNIGQGIKTKDCICNILTSIIYMQEKFLNEKRNSTLELGWSANYNTIPIQLIGNNGSIYRVENPIIPDEIMCPTSTWFRVTSLDIDRCCAVFESLWIKQGVSPIYTRTNNYVNICFKKFSNIVCLPAVYANGPPIPGQGLVAFTKIDNSRWQIFVMYEDGTEQTNISNSSGFDSWPTWSPDRKRIAFTRDGEIYIMNANGTNQSHLNTKAIGNYPAWSKDGKKIAFERVGSIFTMNPDGSQQTQLTTNNVDSFPTWSPDGTKIAFSRNNQIYTISSNGNIQYPLNAFGSYPNWSKDGTKIAFERAACIYLMNSDGSDQRQLTFNNTDYDPTWSPDSSKIIFPRRTGLNYELFIMNADGTNLKPLSTSAIGFYPSWDQ